MKKSSRQVIDQRYDSKMTLDFLTNKKALGEFSTLAPRPQPQQPLPQPRCHSCLKGVGSGLLRGWKNRLSIGKYGPWI
ncbi:OLC1v1013377C1 [Oldenlandia corymbosa var. corymbosa]|uniref:OLC1v1013377C1 n=1 Tax=Oldenlandia corymbosa var. corymbosa TaxID=529605 RepID=A0AAV1E081_OLDCO|nr:OLC1v1013377C1 [Oldenlandia corymbosa var. corymbosa]